MIRFTSPDYRERFYLAQRNSISAPYSLNVGQTLQVGNASGTPITGGNAITRADAAQQGVATSSHKIPPLQLRLKLQQLRILRAQVNSVNKMLPKQQACWDGCPGL